MEKLSESKTSTQKNPYSLSGLWFRGCCRESGVEIFQRRVTWNYAESAKKLITSIFDFRPGRVFWMKLFASVLVVLHLLIRYPWNKQFIKDKLTTLNYWLFILLLVQLSSAVILVLKYLFFIYSRLQLSFNTFSLFTAVFSFSRQIWKYVEIYYF